MLKVVIASALALLALVVQADAQQGVLRIAAIVNDDIISVHDLSQRVQLVVSSTNIPNTQDVVRRVVPQILRTLIDERIRRQEAERSGIALDDNEIPDALAEIEKQNHVPAGKIDGFLEQARIPKDALMDKLRADLLWNKYVMRKLRPQVRVSDEEVDEVVARIRANKGNIELRVAEIYLPIEDPKRFAEVRSLAERLIDQTRQGADFDSIAQNFSQSPSAAAGGDLGWLAKGQIEDSVFEALKDMQPGAIAGPVESPTGIQIYLLKGKRTAEGLDGGSKASLDLTQMVVPLSQPPSPAAVAEATNKVKALAAKANDCRSFRQAAKETGTPLSGDIGTVALASLPAEIQKVVQPLRVNDKSAPTVTRDGVTVYMVCGREGEDAASDPRQTVRNMLVRDKIDLLARRQLRDIRRDAFVDVRM